MKNSEYVQANAFTPNTSHGNLFTDGNGTMYSYGHHYPLLFKVNGLSFVNVTGYSNTTARHISYARAEARHEVELDGYKGDDISPETVKKALEDEKTYLNEKISNIKRKDTKKEARLQERINEIDYTLNRLITTM